MRGIKFVRLWFPCHTAAPRPVKRPRMKSNTDAQSGIAQLAATNSDQLLRTSAQMSESAAALQTGYLEETQRANREMSERHKVLS